MWLFLFSFKKVFRFKRDRESNEYCIIADEENTKIVLEKLSVLKASNLLLLLLSKLNTFLLLGPHLFTDHFKENLIFPTTPTLLLPFRPHVDFLLPFLWIFHLKESQRGNPFKLFSIIEVTGILKCLPWELSFQIQPCVVQVQKGHKNSLLGSELDFSGHFFGSLGWDAMGNMHAAWLCT